MRESISACITAGNEEKNIRRCLESVKWADEIVVVDSFSSDRTVEIVREYTDRVYQHEWLGYIGQKNLIKDLAKGPWIFFVDADEEISPELKDEILNEFESGASDEVAGYEFPRLVKYLGRWIWHGDWYPDIKLRLFRKAAGTCEGKEPHDRISVAGATRRLTNHMYHYTYEDIVDQIGTINRFSSITADGMHKAGMKCSVLSLTTRPILRFLRAYFLRRGFLDGMPGFIIAVVTAYGVFAKFAKLWEFDHAPPGTSPEDR